ncbi:tetratricopeptide repeat protein [Nocardia sp. CDC159]|uniref:Tetratricopeptide repeat protein n=1 Tax=Nocardia pulmonis TaxID=2951408 RepID=A0A9X2E980_9NOCA|nr:MULTISPECIES: BTAD domain-containing putative transcriptional regulator [Nocardia]MCM6776624.1 tetratricopeptide repeat protein [Nocardia pulmonis]MCM6789227.1 tetratricopeptide repeat protein [Nocardia sp. CDC159]
MAGRQDRCGGETGSGVLRLHLLGAVEVWLGESRLNIAAPQQLVVLAVLAAERGRTLSTAQLTGRLWADRQPATAVGVLRNLVLALRRQFDAHGRTGAGAEWLASTRGGYQLTVPVETDVAEAESLIAGAEADRDSGAAEQAEAKLAAALRLWRGDPLVGLPGPWAESERTRLRRLRSTLRESAMAVAMDLGRHSAAVAELEALIAAEPHCERWHELLMLALDAGGRRVEALEVYRNARRLLADELGLEPGPRLVQLHQRILAARPPAPNSIDLSPRGEPGPDRPAPVVRQLPPDIADFVGRDDLIRQLAAELGADSDRRPVVAITGMGGVGKTTLAVHLAHRVRERFPDGLLYLDLGGMDERPRPLNVLLAVALRSVGVDPGDVPPDLPERTALWRSTVAHRRMLLVLDNARDVNQLTPLLPGVGASAVLVTSRSSLAELFDARLVPLDVLTPEEARTLLERMVSAQRVSAEPDAAQEILRACGRLPVSLRIVGARLASRPTWRLAAVAERLADERGRLAEFTVGQTTVESVFRHSYRQLDPELARAFVLLTFSDAPDLSVAAIASLLDREPAEAERLCETLVDLSMVQSPEPGRYRYHDLLRLFGREVADREHREEWPRALRRLADFYLATAKNVAELRDPGVGTDYYAVTDAAGQRFADERQCTVWATSERFGLVALYRQAATLPDPRTRTLAVDLALLLAVAGDAGEHLPQVAQALEVLGRAAAADGDRRTMARAQLAAAIARLVGMGDLRAGRELRCAGAVLREVGDRPGMIIAEQMLGTAATYQGRLDDAVEHFRRAIELVRQAGPQWGEGMSWATIARAYCDAGRWAEAVDAAERALLIARLVGSLRIESMALHELGFAVLQRGDPTTARELCVAALDVARRGGRRHQEGWALTRLAEVILYGGDAEAAVPIAAEAVRALTEVSATVRRLRAMRVHGRALTAAGRAAEAEPILRKVEQLSRRIGVALPDAEPAAESGTARGGRAVTSV